MNNVKMEQSVDRNNQPEESISKKNDILKLYDMASNWSKFCENIPASDNSVHLLTNLDDLCK